LIVPDVNVLLYAFRRDLVRHCEYRDWLYAQLESGAAFGVSELALSIFVRITTIPRAFDTPDAIQTAFDSCNELAALPNVDMIRPGAGHWGIFSKLCLDVEARGNLVPDAYFAALAIETLRRVRCSSPPIAASPGSPVCAGVIRSISLRNSERNLLDI